MKKILLGLIIGVLITTGAVWASEMVQRLEVSNEKGDLRAEVFTGKLDNGVIQLYGKDDILRIQLAADSNMGTALGMRDERGILKTWITEKKAVVNGYPVITLKEARENYYTKQEVEKLVNEAIENALKAERLKNWQDKH